jgi:hypothetical protein
MNTNPHLIHIFCEDEVASDRIINSARFLFGERNTGFYAATQGIACLH